MRRIIVPFHPDQLATLEAKIVYLPVKNDEDYSKTNFTIYGQGYDSQTATHYDIPRWVLGEVYKVVQVHGGKPIWYNPDHPDGCDVWSSIHFEAARNKAANLEQDVYKIARGQGYRELAVMLIGFERIDVRQVDLHTAKVAGFEDQIDLWAGWAAYYDTGFVFRRTKVGMFSHEARRTVPEIQGSLSYRPSRLWEAWQTTIERV